MQVVAASHNGVDAVLIFPAAAYAENVVAEKKYEAELEACPGWEDDAQ